MSNVQFSIQKLAYALICLCIALYVLYIGSGFFVPITFGVLFAFMLKPVCDRIEDVVRSRVLAILLTLLIVGLLIGSIFSFFFIRVSAVVNEADNIVLNLQDTITEVLNRCGAWFGMTSRETTRYFDENFMNSVLEPFPILTSGLTASGYVIGNFLLTILYTFFFLLYRSAFKNFLIGQFGDASQAEGEHTIKEIQHVATDYLSGMLIVMLVLGVLNSLGLWIIGIQYPLVWGFLGALLAIIPYVGTTLGGLLPLLYAIATTTTLWQPAAVVVLYTSVQFVEGNMITPKIVGNSVKINALAAIIALILGAAFWGLAGLVLAIPLLAMLRIILDHIKPLKPIALLLSDDLYDHSDIFLTEFHKPEYRVTSLFNKKNYILTQPRLAKSRKVVNKVSKANPEVITDPKAKKRDSNTSSKEPLVP
ncbi:AI-2E family transporter [Neolewinella aurantiaca]|uniref:AI-2E family transporter n=1 Tax=Neolewinella aurantiaca TaxID=2602767 RepID=A0A5C7FCB5_9BACT|nr:AI-2E family transporter [Neolewinella aurantiaca]TXF88580.1 AI-2E family transporter [Neolewinella aurantiaca]